MHGFALTETFQKYIGNTLETTYSCPYMRNPTECTLRIYSILWEVYFED